MKTKTKIWTALAAIFGMLCVVSCSEKDNGDDEPGPGGSTSALVSKIESSDGEHVVKFDYDAQERISKISFISATSEDDNYDIMYSWAANKVVVKFADDPDITCLLGSDGTIQSAVSYPVGGTITEYYQYGSNARGLYVNYYECLYERNASSNQAYHVEWKNGCVSKVYQDEDEDYSLYSYTNIENKINIDLAEIFDVGAFQSELSSFTYPRSAGLVGVADRYLPSRIVDEWGEGEYTSTSDFEYTLNDQGLPISVTLNIIDNQNPGKVTFKITYK